MILTNQLKAFASFLNDKTRKHKYNPYPINPDGVLFLQYIKEIGYPQVIGFFKLTVPFSYYALAVHNANEVVVLLRQPINLDALPHPFVETLKWTTRHYIIIMDFTILTPIFGGGKSLEQFWRNLAKMD